MRAVRMNEFVLAFTVTVYSAVSAVLPSMNDAASAAACAPCACTFVRVRASAFVHVCVDVCVSVPATPACGNAGEHACVHECMPIYMHACVSAWYAVLGWAGLSCSLLRDAVR